MKAIDLALIICPRHNNQGRQNNRNKYLVFLIYLIDISRELEYSNQNQRQVNIE